MPKTILRLRILTFLFFLTGALSFSLMVEEIKLRDVYSSGKIMMKETLVLDESSMPTDVFFEMSMDASADGQGNVYIADYRAHKIFKFSSSGKFLKAFGHEGQGPGDLSGPAFIAEARGRVLVYEIRNRRFSAFNTEGEFLFHHSEMGLGYRIQKIRALPTGDFVVEWDITNFSEPGAPQEGRIELVGPDMKRKKILVKGNVLLNKIISDPVRTNVPMPYPERFHWEVSPRGFIVVGFSGKYEIDMYDAGGEKIRSISRKHTPIPLIKQDEKDFYDSLTFAASDGSRLRDVPDYVRKHVVFPPTKPVFRDLLVDYEGNILVCLYSKNREEESRTFDAFDPDGNFIASVRVEGENPPPVSSRLRLDRDGFWLCRTDAEGLPVVSKWRIAEFK